MKKLISLILALTMVLSLGTVAFAAETGNVTESGGQADVSVTGTYVEGTTASGTVFSVDIEWTSMSFTYNAEKAPVWDPQNHQYSDTQAAFWEGEGTITVTNHSNTKILAASTYQAESGYEAATMNFSDANLKIASAEVGSAQVGTITVTPSGSLPASANGSTIGTITVKIEQDANVTVDQARELDYVITDFYENAHSDGIVDIHEEEFTAMVDCMAEVWNFIDVYEDVQNGDAAWGENGVASYDEWQTQLNYWYAATLAAYNHCLSLV